MMNKIKYIRLYTEKYSLLLIILNSEFVRFLWLFFFRYSKLTEEPLDAATCVWNTAYDLLFDTVDLN